MFVPVPDAKADREVQRELPKLGIEEDRMMYDELKAREDVLVTDNRNLLDKVKVLENLLRENAEHYKRNEAQIFESSDNEIKKLKVSIDDLKREHHKERHEYIEMVAHCKKKLVEQESENRKLKRALWLARANKAESEAMGWYNSKSYKDYVLANLEGDLSEEYYQSAKEALELSDDDFEKWREETIEKDEDDEEFVDDIQKIRDAGKPSDYMERNSYESAYDAVEECGKEAGIDIDFESVDSIVSDGIKEDYRFLYACCVIQWVANKIYDQFKKDVNNV